MISVILPISSDRDATEMTIISLLESLRDIPHEFLLLDREDSENDPSLLRSGSYQVIDAGDLEYGPLLNLAASRVSDESKALFFAVPGTVFFKMSPELLEQVQRGHLGILGFIMTQLRNPKTGESQDYPSWRTMLTNRGLFEHLGGFDEYLPVLGADFLYCLAVSNSSAGISRYPESYYTYRDYQVVDREKLSVHHDILLKRLPMIMRSKNIWIPLMDNWPGV